MTAVFYLIAGLTLAGALAAVLLKNTVHCALALTIAFAGIAAILVVFAILLTRGSDTPVDTVYSRNGFVGLIAAAAIFAVLGWAVLGSTKFLPNPSEAPEPSVSVQQIGVSLMGRYILPLEIVALLLTAALIGAVIVAMHEKVHEKAEATK
jgi:NADH-quinone oxidoreductase subunit J